MYYHPSVIPSNISTGTTTPEPTPRKLVDLKRPLPVRPPWIPEPASDVEPENAGAEEADDLEDAVDKLAENAITQSVKMIQRRYRGHLSRKKFSPWYAVLNKIRCMFTLKSRAAKHRSQLRWAQLKKLEKTATFTRINHQYYHDLQVSMLDKLTVLEKKDAVVFEHDVDEKITQKVGTDGKRHADLLREGNMEYYNESALIQRAVIQKDSGIRWITTKFYNMLATPKFDYNRSVKKQAYTDLYLNISKCLVADFHRMECLKAIEEDWQRDAQPGIVKAKAQSKDELKKSHAANWSLRREGLHLSLFELADMWVDSVDPFEYKMFLVILYMAVTTRDPDSGGMMLAKVTDLHCLLDGDGNISLPDLSDVDMANGAEDLGVEVMEQAIAVSERVKRESRWTEDGIKTRQMHDEIARREAARRNDMTEKLARKARMSRYQQFIKELQKSVQERLKKDLHWLTVQDELSRTLDAEKHPGSHPDLEFTCRGSLLRLALGKSRGEQLDLQDIKIINKSSLMSREESELIRLGRRRTKELDRQAAKEYNELQNLFPERLRTHPTGLDLTQLLQLFRFTTAHGLPRMVVDALYHGNISLNDLTAVDGTASYRSNEEVKALHPADAALLHAAVAVQRGSDTIVNEEKRKRTELTRHLRKTAETLAKHTTNTLHKGDDEHLDHTRRIGFRQRSFLLHERSAPSLNAGEEKQLDHPWGPWGSLRQNRSPERNPVRPGLKSPGNGELPDAHNPEIDHLLPRYYLRRHASETMDQAHATRAHVPQGTAHWRLRAYPNKNEQRIASPEGSMISYSSLPAQHFGVQAKQKVQRPPDDRSRLTPNSLNDEDPYIPVYFGSKESEGAQTRPFTPPALAPISPSHSRVKELARSQTRPRTSPMKGLPYSAVMNSSSSITKVLKRPDLFLGQMPTRKKRKKQKARLRSVIRSVAAANYLRLRMRNERATKNAMPATSVQELLVQSRELSHSRSMDLQTW